MSIKNKILIAFFMLITFNAYSNVITYPFQTNDFYGKSNKFIVTVFQNDVKKESYTYISKAGNGTSQELYKQQGKTFNYSIFSFSQPIVIEVTKIGSKATTAVLRPNSLGLGTVNAQVDKSGSKIRFTLNQAAKISIEFNDDATLKDAMMIFADSLENQSLIPDISNKDVYVIKNDKDILNIPNNVSAVYFPPGLFTIDYWTIPKNINQVYVSGGSFIRGYFFADRSNSTPLTINGRGILSNDIYPFHYPDNDPKGMNSSKFYKTITIKGGTGHTIEGVTLVDGSAFNILLGASNSIIKNVNINGFKFNNDGITPYGNNNQIINCFIRDNDDAIVIYGNSITVSDCVFWQLSNGSIFQLGWRAGKISGNNTIKNIDVIHAEWDDPTRQNMGFLNCMNSIPNNAEGLVENFLVENINFDTDILRFVDLRMMRNGKGAPNSFKNFVFNNIHLPNQGNKNKTLIYLNGYDDKHGVSDFKFKNIYINQKPLAGNKEMKKNLIQAGNFSKSPEVDDN